MRPGTPAQRNGGFFMWAVYAGLSALFASLTAILGKIGVQGINSNLATAIRTIFVLVMAWGMVFITGAQAGMKDIGGRSLVFLMLSGLATGASWLCYYKVVTIDKFSLILTFLLAALFLGEPLTLKTLLGGVLITVGTLVVAL